MGASGPTCHHARCQARIQAHDGGWLGTAESIAGFRPEVNAQNNLALVEELREPVQTLDFADHVPIAWSNPRRLPDQDNRRAGRRGRAPASRAVTAGWKTCRSPAQAARQDGRRLDQYGGRLKRLVGWFVVPPDAARMVT